MREINISVNIKAVSPATVTEEFRKFQRDTLEESQHILIDEVHTEIDKRNMRVTDDMYLGWDAIPLEEVGDFSRAVVGNDDIAASVAEYGAVPAAGGIVNVSEILAWAKAKPVQVSYGTIEQFAWALAKKIGKQGQPLEGNPKRLFNVAQKRAKRKIERLWNVETERLVRKLENGGK